MYNNATTRYNHVPSKFHWTSTNMVNRINKVSSQVIRLMYLAGLFFGVSVFIYDKRHGQVEVSKPLQVIFPVIKSISVLSHAVYITATSYYYESTIFKLIFAAQSFVVFSFAILLVMSQTIQSQKYINIINDSIRMFNALKIKVGSESFFGGTFLFMFLLKTVTNSYIICCNFPYIFDPSITWNLRLVMINMIGLFLANVIFFNFGFIGLLMTSAFQNKLYEYFQSCRKITDFEEFARIYGQFKVIFKRFIQLTEVHFFYAILFYLVNIGVGLSYFIVSNQEFQHRSATLGFQICCIIDLIIFNMAADFVEKTSRKMDFFKVDFLCNDSLEVMLSIEMLLKIMNLISDGPCCITN